MIAVILDEASHPLVLAASGMGVTILCAGAVGHMLARTEGLRALALVGAGIVAAFSTGLFSSMYWDGRQERWMNAPANGIEMFTNIVVWSVISLVVLGSIASGIARGFAHLRLDGDHASRRS
jgi:hypothetical protein